MVPGGKTLVSGAWCRGVIEAVRRGAARPYPLRPQLQVRPGTARRRVTLNRTAARLPVAWTKQVTVTQIICGVDVASNTLDAHLRPGQLTGRFAEAVGWLEKTDRIDAAVIAWYAEVQHIAAQPPASETRQRLAAPVTRLHQLSERAVVNSNQRRLISASLVCAGFAEIGGLLARQMRTIETAIAELIQADPL